MGMGGEAGAATGDRAFTVRMTAAQMDAAAAGLKADADLRRLVAFIDQMGDLGPGDVMAWRRAAGAAERLVAADDPHARHRQAIGLVLEELLRCAEAYGLGAAGARLLRHHLRALADHNRGVDNPVFEVASRAGEDGTVAWRRMPDRLAENEMIGTACAAIYRRGQAGQNRAKAADEVAALCDQLGLRMPSAARRGRDDAGLSDAERRRCTGPRLLRVFYDLQKQRTAPEHQISPGRRGRFFEWSLKATQDLAPAEAAGRIEDQLRALTGVKTP